MEGSDDLPDFDDWKSLASDGFKVAVVIIGCLIPPIMVSFIFIFQHGSFNLFTSGFTIRILLSGSAVGLIILVLVDIFGLIGMANMALYNGEIRAAFRFNEILERISQISWKNYVIWYILIFVVGLIATLISYLNPHDIHRHPFGPPINHPLLRHIHNKILMFNLRIQRTELIIGYPKDEFHIGLFLYNKSFYQNSINFLSNESI